jgi:hypothetical protein
VRDSAAGDSRAADLIARRARCRPLSYETFDGDRADVTTLEVMMRMLPEFQPHLTPCRSTSSNSV